MAAVNHIMMRDPQHSKMKKEIFAMVKKTKKRMMMRMMMKTLFGSEKSSPVDAREACLKLDGRSEWLPKNSFFGGIVSL